MSDREAYGDFEQVNGAVVNALQAENEELKAARDDFEAKYRWAHLEGFGEDSLDRDRFNIWIATHDKALIERCAKVCKALEDENETGEDAEVSAEECYEAIMNMTAGGE